jgi:hypothetical protein
MRARATAVAAALLALAALVAAARSQRAHAEVAALGSSGDVQVANSKNGTAILGGVLAPGGAVTGTVTIANVGSAAGDFTLSLSHVIDTPGAGGGRLSRQLELAVDDLTPAAGPAPVYRGGLGSLAPTSLGRFEPGESHTYRFAVTWTSSGPADATLAGSSLAVEFDWSAGGAAGPAPAAPHLRVRLARRQRVLRRRGVVLRAGCDQSCTLTARARLSVSGRAAGLGLRAAGRHVPAGKAARLRLRLGRRVAKALRAAFRHHRRARAIVTVTGRGDGGLASSLTRTVKPIR